jgi:hypothetical protein
MEKWRPALTRSHLLAADSDKTASFYCYAVVAQAGVYNNKMLINARVHDAN